MSSEFYLKSQLHASCLLLTVGGYLNNSGGEKIIREFEQHYHNGVRQVILLLNDVNVVNSIGISYLIEMIDKLQGGAGRLIFVNAQPAIEKTFSIMGLYNHALKAKDVNEAMRLVG